MCRLAAEQGIYDRGRDGQLDRDSVVRVNRKRRVPLAENDADGDLPLALGERVIRWMKMVRQRRHRRGEVRIVDPDLRRPLELAPLCLCEDPIALLLLGSHLVIWSLGVPPEGGLGLVGVRGEWGHEISPNRLVGMAGSGWISRSGSARSPAAAMPWIAQASSSSGKDPLAPTVPMTLLSSYSAGSAVDVVRRPDDVMALGMLGDRGGGRVVQRSGVAGTPRSHNRLRTP